MHLRLLARVPIGVHACAVGQTGDAWVPHLCRTGMVAVADAQASKDHDKVGTTDKKEGRQRTRVGGCKCLLKA